jgi:hypothetical protein
MRGPGVIGTFVLSILFGVACSNAPVTGSTIPPVFSSTSISRTTSPPTVQIGKSPTGMILAPGGPGAASGLVAELACGSTDPSQELLNLRWQPASSPGAAQLVEMTIFSEKFDDGRYDASSTLSPDQSTVVWDRVAPGAVHFWRVLTLHDQGWIPSAVARFTPGACIADMMSP